VQVQRARRIFVVLEFLAQSSGGLTVSEISRTTNQPVSSAHDLRRILAKLRMIDINETRYRLGPEAIRLGVRLMDGLEIRDIARGTWIDLVSRTGDYVYLAISIGRRLIYADHFMGDRRVNVRIHVGESLALNSTSAGKSFVALDESFRARALVKPLSAITPATITDRDEFLRELDKMAVERVSISRGEWIPGVLGTCVPILCPSGTVVASVNSSALETITDQKGHYNTIMKCSPQQARSPQGWAEPNLPPWHSGRRLGRVQLSSIYINRSTVDWSNNGTSIRQGRLHYGRGARTGPLTRTTSGSGGRRHHRVRSVRATAHGPLRGLNA